MNQYPKMLKVETGLVKQAHRYFPTDDLMDYLVYDGVSKWWRWIEQLLRMDFYLAFKVKGLVNDYDIIWANSEKVGIPLSFLNIKKPLIVVLHDPESPLRAILLKLSGIARKWAGVGIVSKETRDFLQKNLGVDPSKIIQYYSARTDLFKPAPSDQDKPDSPILSIGVAKRDYETMIEALSNLPGYHTEIFVSSKYGDQYKSGKIIQTTDWIKFPERISDQELFYRYQQARFVVVPLMPTSHSGAGVTSVFEASASGKAVIATNTGGMNSYVVDGKTGILVPPRDVRAMRNAIRTLWENPGLAREMGKAGRKYIEENYDNEEVVTRITAFLTQLWKESPEVGPYLSKSVDSDMR